VLRDHSAIGQYPLTHDDAIPRNNDVIRSIFPTRPLELNTAGLCGCGGGSAPTETLIPSGLHLSPPQLLGIDS